MIHPEDQIIEIISKVMDEISASSARLGPDEIPSHDETMRLLGLATTAFWTSGSSWGFSTHHQNLVRHGRTTDEPST